MRFAAAFFFAMALVAAQVAHGGLLEPFLPYPAYALVGLGMFFALFSTFRSRRQPSASLVLSVIALTGYALWRCWNGSDPALAITDAALILACFGMWAGVSLALTRSDAKFVFVTICFAVACLQVTVAIIQFVRHGEFSQPYWFSLQLHDIYASRFPYRLRGLYMNPNQFAWLMNAMALLALSLGIWGRMGIVRRIALLYLAVIFGTMTVLSASRGGMASLAAGFSVFLVLSLVALVVSVAQRRFLLLGVGAVLLAVCAGAVYAAFSTSWIAQSRLDSLMSVEERGSFSEEAIRLFQTEPLLGVGPGIYRYAARLYRTGNVADDPIFAHNDWLQFPAEYGFVGLALLIVVVALALVVGSRGFLALVQKASIETGGAFSSSGAFVLGAVCALVAEVVHSNVDFNMHIPANALLAAALLGLVTGARPIECESGISRFRPMAWLMALVCMTAAAGLTVLLIQRGEAEYRTLQAANAIERGDVGHALEETERGLRRQPDDAALLALRARGFFEYESWLDMNTPGKTPVGKGATNKSSDEGNEDSEEDEALDEDPVDLLSPAESAKNFRNSAELFSRAIKIQPLERLHDIGLANALSAQDLDEKARPQFIEAIRLDPQQAYPWSKYGDFLFGRDQWLEARRIYEIGASLPGGKYCRSQVGTIDEDRALETEEGNQ